ncbi:MAG: TetR/AcrR family transcriptional regulator [bacterium]|nr:TetR/AcrR family transcriptional regulator [bacterium]
MPSSHDRSPHRDTAAYRRILASAESCFGTLGFRKTSVVDIAAGAQVSKPLVYRYFESKEQLYEVVISRLVKTWNDELLRELSAAIEAPAAEDSAGVAEALRRMHRASLDYARRSPLLRGLLAKESRLLLASYSDIVERTNATLKAQIKQCLESGITTGEVRLDLSVDAMADAVTEIHLAYAERVVSGTEKPNAERLSLDAFECLLFGICLRVNDSDTNPDKGRK